MTYSSLAAARLPINEIKAFSDIIFTGFEYHYENNSIYKSAYQETLIEMSGLSFAVMLIKNSFSHDAKELFNQFLRIRDFKEELPSYNYTETLACIISEAILLISKYNIKDYEAALLTRAKQLLDNVWVSLTGKQKEADHLRTLLKLI